MNAQSSAEVVIIGAGIAGLSAAWVCRQSGASVTLVDPEPAQAPVFQAERVSKVAAGILADLGLIEPLERLALPLLSSATIKGSRIEEVIRNKDYSIRLWELVSELRSIMLADDKVNFVLDRAEAVEDADGAKKVQLRSGEILDCRVVVVATGPSTGLLKRLGISREIISRNHSSTFGFDIEPDSDFRLPSDSVTIRICKDGADYMNIFPTNDGKYRANLFTYWPADGEQIQRFVKGDANAILQRLIPDVNRLTGGWKAVGKIDCGSVSIMKSAGYDKAGVVLIGDAYGRICPCSGMGIDKALRDVLALRACVSEWLSAPEPVGQAQLSQYYESPDRTAYEDYIFTYSLFIRNRLMGSSPGWMLRRWYYHNAPKGMKQFLGQLRRPGNTGSGVPSPV